MKIRTALTALYAILPLAFVSIACSSKGGMGMDNDAGTQGTGGSANALVDSGSDAQVATGDLLVDDFEDGDSKPLITGVWYSYTDASNGGKSELTFTGATGSSIVMAGAGYESNTCLEVTYSFDEGTYVYAPYLGFGAALGSGASLNDMSKYAGISYVYRGGAHRMRVDTSDVTDYDVYGIDVPAAAGWTTVTLPFVNFSQQGWGKKVDFDLSHVMNLSFALTGSTGQTGSLDIDDLKVVGTIAHGPPDMTINPASPPANGVLTSSDIANPLQQKAMKYLTRGYNITNWLEQGKFTGFTYDETYVAKLAQSGFKALRLPIDLDLYVASYTGTGSSLAITVNSDLFTILDGFNAWTKAHGLSLTIDYHQYGTLLDMSKPDSLATAVQLWGKVAEHFASESREDLFFELLNEPELSFVTGAAPTQAEWSTLAEQMIAAIRTTDKVHSIIFGDIQWYGISTLASRTPLSDTNVIYAFHDYDPFIFTHQGASWANMGSTHDIPYPYSPDRWSEYYADLGFTQLMGTWILGQAQSYSVNGSRSAVRNAMLAAKRWGVTNNVPVICNEFGAYEAKSRLPDRVDYYTDVVGIFEELAIPWQIWFMVMDASGVVDPGYKVAMHLGS